MPQLSLYVSDQTLSKIEHGAKETNCSLSKYVAHIVDEHFSNHWPAEFLSALGSVSDESFTAPAEIPFSVDARREAL